jgi:hypothetical protein
MLRKTTSSARSLSRVPRACLAALALLLSPARGSGCAFAVLSDIHVYTNGTAPSQFDALAARLAALRPGFVIVTGDFTDGNEGDTSDQERVSRWWAGVKAGLKPLTEAGIPVLPIAGNHDCYRPVHRQGYAQAWARLRDEAGALKLEGRPPFYYSFDAGGAHFTLMHIVDQDVDPAVEKWALDDISRSPAKLKLGFGHVPLASAMGHTNAGFRDGFGARLAQAGLDVYIAGHEHLVWDETLSLGGRGLRQVIVGTAGANYTFPLSERLFAEHCSGSRCTMPHGGEHFSLVPGTRQQARRQTFLLGDLTAAGLQLRMMALDPDGTIVSFYDPGPAK